MVVTYAYCLDHMKVFYERYNKVKIQEFLAKKTQSKQD